MSEQLPLLAETLQLTWKAPPGRHACGRDPNAGPGSCYHWWDSCAKAQQRGCFLLWARGDELQAYWTGRAPAEWTEAPTELHPATAGAISSRGRIEVREVEGARWQWRRRPAAAEVAA